MKLLGWMHRRFRQNDCEPIDGFDFGQTVHGDHLLRKSFAGIDSVKIEFCGDSDEEEVQLSTGMSGVFHGFLAIGTLGSETCSNAEEDIPMLEFLVEDGSPIFELSVEDIVAEKESEITENDLNLINEELEKALLGLVAEEDVSSGRNSHVSTGRSSHASGGATAVCPLRGYLLGSVVGVSGSKDGTDAGAAKKEQRTTLGELFRMTDEGTKEDTAKKGGEDNDASSVVKFVKKKMMMKKKLVHAVSASKGSDTGVPASSENKLHKILHMFQKKVHPDNERATFAASEVTTRSNGKIDVVGRGISSPVPAGDDVNQLTDNLLLMEKIRRTGNVLAPVTVGGSRECWIKTDEDYLVLEL